MKGAYVLLIGVLVACMAAQAAEQSPTAADADKSPAPAEQPAAASPPAEAPPATPPAEAAPASIATTGKEADKPPPDVVALQAAGFKLVNDDGKKLYCRRESITGSRLQFRTSCFTEAQLEQMHNAAADTLADLSRRAPTPRGN